MHADLDKAINDYLAEGGDSVWEDVIYQHPAYSEIGTGDAEGTYGAECVADKLGNVYDYSAKHEEYVYVGHTSTLRPMRSPGRWAV